MSAATVLVIDLGGGDRAAVVDAVRRAAAEWGFFHVTGHGVPNEVMCAAVAAVRAFHEADGGDGSDKAQLYSREPGKAVKYYCNFDLFQSPVANWRDTLHLPHGAFVVNIGDLLQLVSNGKFSGVEHRMVAKMANQEFPSWASSTLSSVLLAQGCKVRSKSCCPRRILCIGKHSSEIT